METPRRGGSDRKQVAKRDLLLSPNLTPVEVSPGRSPSQGNLTGSARKVKDGAADWHNYIQKWDSLNSRGLAVIKQICNIKLQASLHTEDAVESGRAEEIDKNKPDELEELCKQLKAVLISMDKILEKFRSLTVMFNNVGELELHQNKGTWDTEPLFQTWPTWKYHETSEELLAMYEKEYNVKKTIVENVAHTTDRDLSMVYTSIWLHQPYLSTSQESLLHAMLMECRLK